MESHPINFYEAEQHQSVYWHDKPVTPLEEVKFGGCKPINEKFGNTGRYSSENPIEVTGFTWKTLTVQDDLEKVVKFLNMNNYIDPRENFNTVYSDHYLRRTLGSDGKILTLMFNDIVIATVGYCVRNVTVNEYKEDFAVADFLCVHPKYRFKKGTNKKPDQPGKLVQVVIDELIRTLNTFGVKQGMFQTERYVPTPIATLRWYYRPLNYGKLFRCKYLLLDGDLEELQEHFQIKMQVGRNYNLATEEDLDDIYQMYQTYKKRFNVCVNYTKKQLGERLFNPCTTTLVLKSTKDNKVIDFVTYYVLEHKVKKSKETLKCGYIGLYTCNKEDPTILISNVLRYVTANSEQKDCSDLDLMFLNTSNQNKDVTLTDDLYPEEVSDDETEEKKAADLLFMKDIRKSNVNLFNFRSQSLKQYQVYL